jgi:hypothetical protein
MRTWLLVQRPLILASRTATITWMHSAAPAHGHTQCQVACSCGQSMWGMWFTGRHAGHTPACRSVQQVCGTVRHGHTGAGNTTAVPDSLSSRTNMRTGIVGLAPDLCSSSSSSSSSTAAAARPVSQGVQHSSSSSTASQPGCAAQPAIKLRYSRRQAHHTPSHRQKCCQYSAQF